MISPKTVWKYSLRSPDDYPIIEMPAGAKPLHFGLQDGVPTLWALVNPGEPSKRHAFRFAGTGHLIEEDWPYIGSCFHGPFVWHLFDGGEER
jgi:hypothetical protein